jgi:hypothetical protein
VACDDTYAPKQYFNFFRIARVHIPVVQTVDGTSASEHVLNRLLEFDREPDDELWMLLDTDHCAEGTHLQSFVSAIREAKQQGVAVALSKPCFELWLLLHHRPETEVASLSGAKSVEKALRVSLGEYNKTNLKQEHYPIASVSAACIRAEKLDEVDVGGDLPDSNVSRVHLLWKAIVAKALPSQLPAELRGLLSP